MRLPGSAARWGPGARWMFVAWMVAWVGAGLAARAQETAALPDAPGSTQRTVPDAGKGSISGTVVDADGEAIAGARVTLAGAAERNAVADGEGYYSFLGLAPGNFRLTVAATGFEVEVKPLTLKLDEQMEAPNIVLPVATANTDVEVMFSLHDVAEEQIHTEEKQRLLGAIPNFYVTYEWHAAPMSAPQKFRLAERSIVDPMNFVVTGIIAGVEQSTNAFSGYGQGAEGYGKRYGAGLADLAVGTVLGGAVFPAVFRQDPRYFYKGTGSVWMRGLYALSSAVICRGDNGRWQPNYSSVAADVATGAVSNLYYPAADRNGAWLTVENGLLNAAGDGVGNLLQEFLFKHMSTGVKSKP